MSRTARTARGAALCALLVSVLLSGCGGSTPDGSPERHEPVASAKTPTPKATATHRDEALTAYLRCLEDRGVMLETTAEGVLRVDKERIDPATLSGAEKRCAGRLPAPSGRTADAVAVAKARELSACVRREGYAGYPDPDPATGLVALTEEQARTVRTDPAAVRALQMCGGGGAGGSGGTTVGG
ncbi:hypothetical protein [Streptomyces sp. NPDC059783]|uniref:hypothetical protein n=1 Tax=Streptomyces sp. NPDC059783 TaxID=3346944 RepID=UPI0036614116